MPSDVILHVSDLNVKLNNNPVIEKLGFSVRKGETLAIIGPNGAGKTVLFRTLLGLVPFSGQIVWKPKIRIGYVPQRLYIESDLPLTTAEFFALKNVHSAETHRVLAAVGFIDPHEILNSKLGILSGGQLQRVLIAWALAGHPDILLFDEPTTGVDLSAEESIYSLLKKLQTQENLTLILISHELQVVYRYATNVLCLNKEGLCYGPPHQALTQDALSKLFGEHTSIYHHQHQV
jgi:zinc transport system ATP-binding protein